MAKVYMYGIDISTWQGNFNLAPYKKQFVIIRAGYGTKVDSKAVRNMNECEKLGIPYGVYWYSYALNANEAIKEAKKCIETIKGRKIQVGVWFDMEDADKFKQKHKVTSASAISDMCKAFCKKIADAGYYAGIYASSSWFNTKIKGCDKYDKWVASWGKNNGKQTTDTSAMGSLQQYTSRPIDKNVMYVPLSTFSKKKTSSTQATTTKKKTVDEIAKEVLDGKWGSGDERKKKLTKAGYNYDAVQKKVNELVDAKNKYTIKFDANGGSGKMKDMSVKKGASVALTANEFKRNGYKFVGWAVKDGKDKVNMTAFQIGEVKYKNKATVKDLGNITLYAVWKGYGAQAACDWAVRIAKDNSFSYGEKPYSKKYGCYYCGTNGKKKEAAKKDGHYCGDKWDKTYACSPFINASYAHGANNQTFLEPEKKGGLYLSGGCHVADEKKKSALEWRGKPKIADLKNGDIIIKDGKHTAMYIGNGKYVDAVSSEVNPFGANTINVRDLTDKVYNSYTDVFRVK